MRTTLLANVEALPAVLAALSAARPVQLELRPPSLEQLFLDNYIMSSGDQR